MTDWITFDAIVEPMIWGDNTYTIVRLPDDVAENLSALGAKRVEGEFNEHAVNLALTKAPVLDGIFVWAGKSLLTRLDIEPGEPFEARLRPADPDHVDVAEDVLAALRKSETIAQWEALTAGQKRSKLYAIDTAKRADTRARRITAMIEAL